MRNKSRVLVTMAAVASVLALVACSEEQLRDVEGATVAAILLTKTERTLREQGVDLDGRLDCEADIADDGAVTGSCTGKADGGDEVTSSLTGTVDVDDAKCTSVVRVMRGATELLEQDGFDCLEATD